MNGTNRCDIYNICDMKGLIALVNILRPSEKRLLLHHFSRSTNAESKMRMKLFRLIDAGKATSDSEAKKGLQSKSTASAYSHLKRRLKDDILNILLMQDTSKRFAQPNRAAELDCRKKVAQSHLLLLRGAQVEGMKVLESALDSAIKYELLAEKLQIHHLLREKFLGTRSSDELINLNKTIQKDLKSYEALLQVQEKSFVLASPEFAQKLKKRTNDKQHLELIEELNKLYKKHRLARIGFWYYMAATEYHSARANYETVVELGLKFLKLVEKSAAVRSKNNIAGVNQTVGVALMANRNFNEAIQHFGQSASLFAVAGFNRLQSLQFLVQCEIALSTYNMALEHVNQALAHPRITRRDYLVPRWLYFKACVEFLNDNAEESFRTLNREGFITKQVDEWNVQFRLLEMMQLIVFKDEEWLEFKIDATRKFLNRHKELASMRVKVAIDVFANLLRRDLDFEALSDKNKEGLRACLEESKGYEWNPTGPELVRFDKWVTKQIPDFVQESSSGK